MSVLLALGFGACGETTDDAAPPADPAEFAAESLGEATSGSDAVSDTTPQESLSPTEIPGEPINRFDLDVGDCFDLIDTVVDGITETITTQIACEDPHGHEIYYRLNYPAEHPSPFPGDEVVREYALGRCYEEFEGWVASSYEVSALDIGVIVPAQEDFEDSAARYRGIHCWVERFDGDPMVGTSFQTGW